MLFPINAESGCNLKMNANVLDDCQSMVSLNEMSWFKHLDKVDVILIADC